jgi:glucose-6-phosphate-specific signal transduction histidine kinase
VANAVQHAAARQVTIAAALQDDALLLAFRNDSYVDQPVNGHAQIDGIQSQSLARRLKLLGGTAYFDNINDKTLLSIRIPLKATEKRG